MNKQKGFTLIELLAVIIILAVIALIATPIVLNVIDSAKKQAAKESVYGYAEAVKLARYEYMFKNEGLEPTRSDLGNITHGGAKVTCETETITNGKIELGCCSVANYKQDVKFDYKDSKVEESVNGKCTITNPGPTNLTDSKNPANAQKEGDSLYGYLNKTNLTNDTVVQIPINDVTYSAHVYNFDGNQVWTENKVFGDQNDIGTSTEYAKNMVIVKVNGNLTINEGVTVSPYFSEYGGPKGFLIYVTGTLTNNGIIDNSHGAYAEGDNIYLFKNTDEKVETVPKEGASGGAGILAYCCDNAYNGNPGNNGIDRQTGGGGGGSSVSGDNTPRGTSGSGGTGSSYSGGSGGGGSDHNSNNVYRYAGNGSSLGGAGGYGYGYRESSAWAYRYAGGGAGNPGGYGGALGGNNVTTEKGEDGTGGLLIIYSGIIKNNGTIKANGAMGSTYGRACGGSSGGGSINIFYGNAIANTGTIEALGAEPNTCNVIGGKGGDGSVVIGSIASGSFEINTELSKGITEIDNAA